MQKMLQQVMTAPGHIEFREAPVPAPNAGEVLVKIMKIGVCGSDIHVYHGEHPFTKYPVTQGHEVSGKIAALGEGVTGFAIGQKVTIEPQVYCGRCHPCTHGKYNLCEELRVMGFQTTGTASEYFAVDAGKVTPLPETMTYSEGAMIEPLAVTVHAVRRAGDVCGQKIAVLGAGPIGIIAAGICKYAGARRVVITDMNEYRLELAKKLGATRTVNLTKEKLPDVMAELGMKEGFDVGLEMSGAAPALNDMIANMKHGGNIALLGIQKPGVGVNWETIIWNGLNIRGIYGRKVWDTWYKMSTMLQAGLDISDIITHHFDIKDFQKGFDAMISGNSGKVILDWAHVND